MFSIFCFNKEEHNATRKFFPELDWSGVVIRDPIYGDIKLSKWEQKLISTPICSRMRDIHQLGFVYLSYTGANHTRFEHCIGTMAAADRLLHMVNLKESDYPFNEWYKKPESGWTRMGMKCFRQALRICALLHDTGHAPYSHACENLLRENGNLIVQMKKEIKDKYWEKLPSNTSKKNKIKTDFKKDCESLCKILNLEAGGDEAIDFDEPSFFENFNFENLDFNKLGDHETYTKLAVHSENYGIKQVIEEWINSEEEEWKLTKLQRKNFLEAMVWLAAGKYPPKSIELEALIDVLYPIATFIDGDLDADKIDYVARDNWHCGFSYQLDWSHVSNNIYVKKAKPKDTESNEHQLAFDKQALFFLTSVIQERYNFGYNVHNETWNVFIERNIIPKLKRFLVEYNHKDYIYKKDAEDANSNMFVSKKILDMHTQWQDGELRFYLQDFEDFLSGAHQEGNPSPGYKDEWEPTNFKNLMVKKFALSGDKSEQDTTQVTTVREDARIDIAFDEMTPPVRKIVHVLAKPEMRSNPAAKKCLDEIEVYFNDEYAKCKKVFVVYFYTVRPLKFTALVHKEEKEKEKEKEKINGKEDKSLGESVHYYILDNQIIRGIMNESLKQFGVCVLGAKDIKADANYEVSACKDCRMYTGTEAPQNDNNPDQPNYHMCIKGHTDKQKVLLDQIITCYRKFCKVCATDKKIIFSDFILYILNQLNKYIEEPNDVIYEKSVDATTLYNICRKIAKVLKEELNIGIFEKVKFDESADSRDPDKPDPYEFLQELRTCAYIGLIDSKRNITKQGRYKPFRRTYSLSIWGKRYFVALEKCHTTEGNSAYMEYREVLGKIAKIFDKTVSKYQEIRNEIDITLYKWDKERDRQIGKLQKNLSAIEQA